MKKIFTSISLAALSFLAATPMSAQQQVTAEQAGAFVEAVIPAMLDQVKTISGLDVKALLAGDESGFLTTNALPTVTIQPDSAHVNVKNILKVAGKGDKLENYMGMITMSGINLEALPVYFSEYTTLTMAQPASMKIEMPGVISSSSVLGTVAVKIDVTPAQNAVTAIPFSSLKVDLELSGLLAGIVSSMHLKSGNVLSMDQKTENGIITTTVTLGDLGMTLNAMLNGEEAAANLKSMIIVTDPTQKEEKGYIKKTTKFGLATVDTQIVDTEEYIYNMKQSIPLVADSVVTLNYDDDGLAIDNYTKKTYEVGASSSDGDYIHKIVTEYFKTTAADEWEMIDKEITEMGATTPLDPNRITTSAILSVIQGMGQAGEDADEIFAVRRYKWDDDTQNVILERGASVEAQKKDDSLVSIITIQNPIEGEENADEDEFIDVMAFITTLAKDGGKTEIIIPVQGNIEAGLSMGTLFFQTNLLQFVTANEAIAPVSDVTINVAENGIYVNNCEKGRYSIVSINGKVVANGIISGEGAFIATPGLQRGQVYIIAVEENGAVKAIKFVK
ncbi:MAG: DUF6383 domain-containing protein [Parabacteroides sp.]|nr:DUF6383 domain-containing protein [Parabacteroides sp.]